MPKPLFLGIFKKRSFLFFATFLFLAGALGLFQSEVSGQNAQSVEVGFFSLSPLGSPGGAIIPASCASGYAPHPAMGDSNCNIFSFTADDSSVPLAGNTNLRWAVADVYWFGTWGQLQGCTASGEWSGDKTVRSGVENTGPLAPEDTIKTYTLTCSVRMNNDGNIVQESKSVPVAVGSVSIPPPSTGPNCLINGQTGGSSFLLYPNTQKSFAVQGIDPEGDQVRYNILSDGLGGSGVLPSSGYNDSGTVQTAIRDFPDKGTYVFRAQTEDVNGNLSPVCTHTVTVDYPLCECKRDLYVCNDVDYTARGPRCNANNTCVGTRSCDFNWQEVAP